MTEKALPKGVVNFPPVETPLVSVVVLGWRDAPWLIDCLSTLHSADTGVPFEVIVPLNEPTEELLERLSETVNGVELVVLPVNTGFAGGCNRGVARSRGEHVVLLNDDCSVTNGWLDALVSVVAANPLIGAVGSTFVDLTGNVLEAGSVLWRDGTVTLVDATYVSTMPALMTARPVDYAGGESLLVRRETWDAVGGLSSDYYPAYYEDADLCLKIEAHGQQTWFTPDSMVVQAHEPTTSFPYRVFLSARNRRAFVERWRTELASYEVNPDENITGGSYRPGSSQPGLVAGAVARTVERIAHRHKDSGPAPTPKGEEVRRPVTGSVTDVDRPPDVEAYLRAELSIRREYEADLEQHLEDRQGELNQINAEVTSIRAELADAHHRIGHLEEERLKQEEYRARLEYERKESQQKVAFLRSRPGYVLVDRLNEKLSARPRVRRVARWLVHALHRHT